MKYIVSKPLTETVRKLVVLETRRRMLKKGVEGSVTDEMIQSAKDFPFEELYEFKRNFAKCPFHDDKSPSMSLKNNRVKCWSCNKSWDTIQFVMDKDGLSFREAVMRLQ